MRFIRSALIGLTLAGAATLTGGAPAFAVTLPHITVQPTPAKAGDHLLITAACGADATSATIVSAGQAFPMQSTAHPGVFQDISIVPANIPPGTYADEIHCSNGHIGTAVIEIASASGQPPTSTTPTAPSVPVGVPETGDGATSTVTGGPLTPVGIALIGAGGLAAGAAAIRRRRRSGSPSTSR